MTKPAISLGGSVIQALRPLSANDQTVAVGAASTAQATPVTAKTSVVRIVSTTDCHLALGNGADPTATTANLLLPASVIEYFKVFEDDRFAVIQNAAGGTLFIGEFV